MKFAVKLNIILAFLLIVWGGMVRNMHAGLACPDWPLCHGQIIPPFELLILIEWGHRLLAASVGTLTFGILLGSLFQPIYREIIGFQAVWAVVLVITQALLGALTVKGLLSPKWVALHLAVGLFYFSVLLWMHLGLSKNKSEIYRSLSLGWKRSLIGLTLLVYVQTVLGGWVAASGAGLACPDFPMCNGAWIPPLEGLKAIHFFHRFLALSIFLYGITLLGYAFRYKNILLSRTLFSVVVLIITQIMLGIGNVLFQIPKLLSMGHLTVATILFAFLFSITYKVHHVERLS